MPALNVKPTTRKRKTLADERARKVRSIAKRRALIVDWINEAERRLADAERIDAKQAAAYLRGRIDAYRDCVAVLYQ